jgi:hypothetical protein
LYVFLITPPPPHAYYMSQQSHHPWFDHPNNIWWRLQIMELLKMASCLFMPLGPNILLSTLFSNTLNLCCIAVIILHIINIIWIHMKISILLPSPLISMFHFN